MPRGIMVDGRWYPVLKMAWVEGETLDKFVEKHVGEAATIQRERSVAGERRVRISGPSGVVILKRYEPLALESARREAAIQGKSQT